MISITQSQNRHKAPGFTLAEVLISTALSVTIMAAVLTMGLFIDRSGYRAAAYTEMDQESRQSLEYFARDARMAKDILWNSATSITLSIPTDAFGNTAHYRYWYDANRRTFSRQMTSPSLGSEQVLITGITQFELKGFKIDGTELSLTDLSAAAARTKQIQLSLKSNRTRTTVAESSAKVLSARYILRNKRVAI